MTIQRVKGDHPNTVANLESRQPSNATKLPILPTPNRATTETTKPTHTPFRRLSDKEMEAKLAKNECFWCTAKWVRGHDCRGKNKRQLYRIEVEEEDETIEDNGGNDDNGGTGDSVGEDNDFQISIHALIGSPSYSTMRVKGTMGTRQLHILIDSGSTDNFIDTRLAQKL